MAYAPVNGQEIYYELHGSGRPLVLLHGAAMSIGGCFAALIPALARLRRVVAIEMQGHGHSADIDREFTVANAASDVVGVLDHLGIEEADIFGYSLGGLVSLQTVMGYPDRVGQVVAACVAYRPDGYHDGLGPDSPRLPTEADFREMRAAYTAIAPFPDRFDELAGKISSVPSTVVWRKEELRAIRSPVLLVVGDTDMVRIEHVSDMLDLIPDARMAVLPDTTHMGVIRRADLVLPMVERFLR